MRATSSGIEPAYEGIVVVHRLDDPLVRVEAGRDTAATIVVARLDAERSAVSPNAPVA